MRTQSAIVSVLACMLAFPTSLSAQKRCVKGKPCGNTCIAANRTCHIPSTPKPADTSRRAPISSGVVTPAAAGPNSPTLPDSLLPWLAVSNGLLYYASACSGAQDIPTSNRRYFRSTAELQRLAFTRAWPDQERCTLEQLKEHERRLVAAGQKP